MIYCSYKKTSFLLSLLLGLGLSGRLMAATRIKTVEYTFGSYDGLAAPADIASNGLWTPATLTVYLPETGKTIRSAWLEVFAHATSVNATDAQVRFNTGATPATVVDNINAQITNQTGEAQLLRILADVTAQVTTASPQVYSMDFRLTGPASNSHSAKLYITYEYDDTSATFLRTVRFPLYSAGNIATKEAQAAAGTHGLTYNVRLGEGTDATVRQSWFEIHGFQQNGGNTTDATVRAEISGQAAGKLIALDMVAQTDRWFQYVTPNLAGFAINSNQTLNVTLSKAVNVLGGEVVVTYESPSSTPVKTKTVKYFFNQGASGAASAFSPVALNLEEGGLDPKELYARMNGSFSANAGTNRTLTVTSSVAGQAVTPPGYALVRTAADFLSHHVIFHSFKEQIASLTDGAVVDLDHNGPGGNGPWGVELIVTYQYSDDTNYTAYYEVFGGQKANAVSVSFADDFTTYFPENAVYVSTESIWLDACMFSHTAVASKQTLTSVDSQANQTVSHQNDNESTYFRYLRGAGDVVTKTPGTHTTSQTNGTSNTNAAYNFTAKAAYSYQVVLAQASVVVDDVAVAYGNNGKKSGLLKVSVTNADTANSAEVGEFKIRLTDGNDNALSAAQAQGLFQNIFVYTDNAAQGTPGTYQPLYDTAAVATVTNAQLGNASVFSNGLLTINNANGTLSNPDTTPALQLGPGGSTYYYLAAELASNAAAQTPNTFDFRLDPDGSTVNGGSVTVRAAATNQPMAVDPAPLTASKKQTAVAPASGAAGFTPPDFGAPVYSVATLADDGKLYVTAANGFIYRVNPSNGTVEQSFNTGSPIRSTPWWNGGSDPPPPYSDLYFGNDAGTLYRINGALSAATWTRAVGGAIRSSPLIDASGVFVGTGGTDDRLRKQRIDTGGNLAGFTAVALGGDATSSPSLFPSVTTVYIGSESTGNSFFAINSGNGTVTGQINVGSVVSSPFTDPETGYIYFGSTNGNFYARNGSTLATIPGWTDFPTGSSIQSSPFVTKEAGVKFVYFGADNGRLYKLNAATGALIWRFPDGTDTLGPIRSAPVPDDAGSAANNPSFITFGTDDGGFYVLQNLSGPMPALRSGFPVFQGAEIRSGATINWVTPTGPKQVFVVSLDGKLYRWDIP